MLKWFCVFILLFCSIGAKAELVEISVFETYIIKTEPTDTIIYDPKNAAVIVEKIDNQNYRVSLKRAMSSSTVTVIGSKGVKTYLIKASPIDRTQVVKKNKKTLLKGFVRYNDQIHEDLTRKTGSRQSQFNLYSELSISDKYSFWSNFVGRNNYDTQGWLLDSYYLKLNHYDGKDIDWFLYHGALSELIDRPMGFIGNQYLGEHVNYSGFSDFDINVWQGRFKGSNDIVANGLNLKYKHLGLGYAQSEFTKIYNVNSYINLTENLTFSATATTDNKTYLVSDSAMYNVPLDWQYLGLRYIQYSSNFVPEYSFGLFQQNIGSIETHNVGAMFSNKDMPDDLTEDEKQLIPGALSNQVSYSFSKFDAVQKDLLSLSGIYNGNFVFTGLNFSYDQTYFQDQVSKSLNIRPYFEVFFSAIAGRGWSLRNSHAFTRQDSNGQVFNQQSSSLGLYNTEPAYRYGVFVGTGENGYDSVNNSVKSSTFLYGADLNFRKKHFSYGVNYQRLSVSKTNKYTDQLKGQVMYRKDDHLFSGTLIYKKNQSNQTLEDVSANFAYTFFFDKGSSNLSETIDQIRTTVKGNICVDKNFNFKCDDGDEYLDGLNVQITTEPDMTITKSNKGAFSFSNLPAKDYILESPDIPSKYKPVTSKNITVSRDQHDYSFDIALIEAEEVKIKPVIDNMFFIDAPIFLDCMGRKITNFEVKTDYISMIKPKGMKCEINLDFNNFKENIYIEREEFKNGIHYFYLDNSKKQVIGKISFSKKPAKLSVYVNSTEVNVDEQGNFVLNIDENYGALSFHKAGFVCEQSPSYLITYDQIKKSIFVNLRCISK